MIKRPILRGMVVILSMTVFSGCRHRQEPLIPDPARSTPVLRSREDGVMGTQLKITVIGKIDRKSIITLTSKAKEVK